MLENWADPVKMGVPVTLFCGLLVCVIVGVTALRKHWILYLALVVGVGASTYAATRVKAPADPNFWRLFPSMPKEHPDYLAWSLGEIDSLNLLPDYGRVTGLGSFRPGARLADVRDEFFDREFQRDQERHEVGSGSVVLALTLERPWVGSRFLRRLTDDAGSLSTGASAEIAAVNSARDLTKPGTVYEISSWDVPWSAKPARVRVVHQHSGLISIFMARGDQPIADLVSQHFDGTLLASVPSSIIPAPTNGGLVLNLRVPAAATIQVVETLNFFDGLLLVWEASLTNGTLTIDDPKRLFHN
ncbi:MAG: hypothetical protein ACI9OJ_004790 [Myxococcota bacterium]